MTDELKQWEYDKGYTKGYSDGRASLIEELEKIKEAIIEKYWDCDICKYNGHFNIRGNINDILQIINRHISELKGESEILNLYYGMSKSMQKAIKDIMIVTQEKKDNDN